MSTCELCGEPMPPGEEMFKFHGYSGNCPKPPKPAEGMTPWDEAARMLAKHLNGFPLDLQRDLASQIAAARARIAALTEFARWAIQESAFSGWELDGGDVQDKATKLGLLTKVAYDPDKHGEHEYAEPGDDFYVFSAALAEPGKPAETRG